MLLEALKIVDLQDWKFYLIGPMEANLKADIEKFYYHFPEKRNQVILTGPIYDKKNCGNIIIGRRYLYLHQDGRVMLWY